MGCIPVPLLAILVRQYGIIYKESISKTDYWLLQFPFEIHCGWICAAFALNLNIVGVASDASAAAQVAVAAISLVALTFAAFACIGLKIPQFTLPWVVVWATVSEFGVCNTLLDRIFHIHLLTISAPLAQFWMSYELSNPKQSIMDTFSSEQIHAFFISTRVLSGIIGLITLMRWIQYRIVTAKSLEESTGLLRSDGEIS